MMSKLSFKSLVISIFFLVALLPSQQIAFAESSQNRSHLFSSRAANLALKSNRNSDAQSGGRNNRADSSLLSTTSLGEQFELDTVDDLLAQSSSSLRFYAAQRSIAYLGYIDEWIDVGLDDLGEQSVAEKLLFYETASHVSDFLSNSRLEEYYLSIVRKVKKIRDYTTVGVDQQADGGLNLDHGQRIGRRLVELKFHMNTREGLQPRLRFTEALSLKYDVLEGQTLLDYTIDF